MRNISTYSVESVNTFTSGSGKLSSAVSFVSAVDARAKSLCIASSLSLPSLAVNPQAKFDIESFTWRLEVWVVSTDVTSGALNGLFVKFGTFAATKTLENR